MYRKRGMTNIEAMNRAIHKLIQKKQSTQINGIENKLNTSSTIGYDPELYSKLKKTAGLSVEESMKTIQLKKEIDNLMNQRMLA